MLLSHVFKKKAAMSELAKMKTQKGVEDLVIVPKSELTKATFDPKCMRKQLKVSGSAKVSEPSTVYIYGHGGQDKNYLGGERAKHFYPSKDGKVDSAYRLDFRKLGDMIADTYAPDTDLKLSLISCNAGAGQNSFAKQLTEYLAKEKEFTNFRVVARIGEIQREETATKSKAEGSFEKYLDPFSKQTFTWNHDTGKVEVKETSLSEYLNLMKIPNTLHDVLQRKHLDTANAPVLTEVILQLRELSEKIIQQVSSLSGELDDDGYYVADVEVNDIYQNMTKMVQVLQEAKARIKHRSFGVGQTDTQKLIGHYIEKIQQKQYEFGRKIYDIKNDRSKVKPTRRTYKAPRKE